MEFRFYSCSSAFVIILMQCISCRASTERRMAASYTGRAYKIKMSIGVQDVFIVGSKGIPGTYGGYETFVDRLTEYHQRNSSIRYYVACKSDENGEFTYHGAHCFKIKVPDIGPAQAVYYDLAAMNYCIKYIKKHKIQRPIIYVLACRIGPFAGHYCRLLHRLGGRLYVNPDGHEWMRAKWSKPIRKYWKLSERLMVKHSDLLICDSKNIEQYIQREYAKYHPHATYISYGAESRKSRLSDDDKKLTDWYAEKGVSPNQYYLVVGRFVPENNYEIMIREFMKSHSTHDFVLITNVSDKFLNELKEKTHFDEDSRIKFVGTVYDSELLMKIRENAYGYFHGHEVGGTNPSLLEALGATKLNLLLDVGFNKEVAESAALYWTKENDNLAKLIDYADSLSPGEIDAYGEEAKQRVKDHYSWPFIASEYEKLFLV